MIAGGLGIIIEIDLKTAKCTDSGALIVGEHSKVPERDAVIDGGRFIKGLEEIFPEMAYEITKTIAEENPDAVQKFISNREQEGER